MELNGIGFLLLSTKGKTYMTETYRVWLGLCMMGEGETEEDAIMNAIEEYERQDFDNAMTRDEIRRVLDLEIIGTDEE